MEIYFTASPENKPSLQMIRVKTVPPIIPQPEQQQTIQKADDNLAR
jgi:hypothetical protein